MAGFTVGPYQYSYLEGPEFLCSDRAEYTNRCMETVDWSMLVGLVDAKPANRFVRSYRYCERHGGKLRAEIEVFDTKDD